MIPLSMLLVARVITVASPQGVTDPNKIVCQLESIAGTRIPRRICRTEAQWAEITEQNKRMFEDQLNKNTSGDWAAQLPR